MTFWQVARRPRWIALLVFVMAVAAVFAWLGKWQVERAVISSAQNSIPDQRAVPLSTLASPGVAMTEAAAARRVTVEAQLDTSSVMVLANRLNFGVDGYWVIGRLTTFTNNEVASLPAALGWAPTREVADAAVAGIRDSFTVEAFMPIMGRLMPPQQPTAPDPGADPTELTTMSVAALANIWPLTVPTYYEGYLVLDEPPAGLDTIESVPVITDASLNWLNVFYAIEWVVFAGFAFFLWYRLVRDALNREIEEQAPDEAPLLLN
jgi:cytochrome oxidase assembly protein ShyY1